MNDLIKLSVEIILANQAPGGAYVASPNFPTYHYCWFRDGSYIAHAMDLAGQHVSAQRFHQWAAERVNDRRDVVCASLKKARAGLPLKEEEILHTRYRLDGQPDEPGQWPNFQLDGFGTWLWALSDHMQRKESKTLPDEWRRAADLVAEYLTALWDQPCFDCWEEFPDKVHPHTLAAIYGGLMAHGELTGADHQATLTAIQRQLEKNAAEFGHFVKFAGSPAVDASLLGLAVPYGVVSLDDPRMLATVEQIRQTLLREGGVHRYAADTYYGGGGWVLLSAWLGWYNKRLAVARPDLAEQALAENRILSGWIEAQAGSGAQAGWLPEQVASQLNNASYYPLWVERWGVPANPLLWSQAEYLIMQLG